MRISDEELRRRLGAHSYPVPPITDSTRGVLLKKLSQLDDAGGGSGQRVSRGGGRRTPLFDYSSAEDEEPSSPAAKRRGTLQSNNNNSGLNNGRRTPRKKTINGALSNNNNNHPNRHSKASRVRSLLSHSEEEEEEDSEEEDSEESLEEEDVEEEEEEEEEDEEEERRRRRDEGSSYSSLRRLPLSSTNNSSSSNSASPNAHHSHRFASSTPLSSTIRSTASYLEGESSNHASTTPRAKPDFSPLSSTLRKQIASNKESFGSLGEALSSLPSSSTSSHSTTTTTSSRSPLLYANGVASASSPPPKGILTQASPLPSTPNHPLQKEFKTKRSSFCNSHSISKIIIVLAGIFFSAIAFKYSHLRPNPNILNRLVICETPSSSGDPCVSERDAEAFMLLHKRAVLILEKKGVELLCGGRDGAFQTTHSLPAFGGNASFTYPMEKLFEELIDGQDLERHLFDRFVDLLAQNPQWGLLVSQQGTEISLYNPPIDWSCWLSLKIGLTYSLLLSVCTWLLRLVGLLLIGYGLHRWRLWYQERRLRENQDVFELVEHVLSILATQNTLVLREGRSSGSSPCIAINHIRDQLISPQDRDKKKKLWDKVVHYIRKSESRVREGTQKIYGEEVEVWQWIPDIRWGQSSLNQHGPNPYVPGVAASSPSNSPPPPPLPPSQWQGSAFSSLNKNVAAPTVAPTTCLKVRHMFDRTSIGNARWVWQVKEEILRRCSGSATILHIAVDKPSSEGCVYIKTSNTDGAGAVFRCLHGQWYRGNLVTVKYLREERYLERFPDSRFARTPLLPQTN